MKTKKVAPTKEEVEQRRVLALEAREQRKARQLKQLEKLLKDTGFFLGKLLFFIFNSMWYHWRWDDDVKEEHWGHTFWCDICEAEGTTGRDWNNWLTKWGWLLHVIGGLLAWKTIRRIF